MDESLNNRIKQLEEELKALRSLVALPEVVKLEQTCEMCPSQWDAFGPNGEYYYIRYRWGYLSVSTPGPGGKEIFSEQDKDLGGYLSEEEMKARLMGVLKFR